jgi:hypothetical protein
MANRHVEPPGEVFPRSKQQNFFFRGSVLLPRKEGVVSERSACTEFQRGQHGGDGGQARPYKQ